MCPASCGRMLGPWQPRVEWDSYQIMARLRSTEFLAMVPKKEVQRRSNHAAWRSRWRPIMRTADERGTVVVSRAEEAEAVVGLIRTSRCFGSAGESGDDAAAILVNHVARCTSGAAAVFPCGSGRWQAHEGRTA